MASDRKKLAHRLAKVTLASVFGGPLGGLVVFAVPWVVDGTVGARNPFRAGALGDRSLYGWQSVAAALIPNHHARNTARELVGVPVRAVATRTKRNEAPSGIA